MIFGIWRCCRVNKTWKIPEQASDWECDWQGSERFQLRYFRALSFSDKVRAVEHMCETAQYFQRRAAERGKSRPA